MRNNERQGGRSSPSGRSPIRRSSAGATYQPLCRYRAATGPAGGALLVSSSTELSLALETLQAAISCLSTTAVASHPRATPHFYPLTIRTPRIGEESDRKTIFVEPHVGQRHRDRLGRERSDPSPRRSLVSLQSAKGSRIRSLQEDSGSNEAGRFSLGERGQGATSVSSVPTRVKEQRPKHLQTQLANQSILAGPALASSCKILLWVFGAPELKRQLESLADPTWITCDNPQNSRLGPKGHRPDLFSRISCWPERELDEM